MGCRWIVCSVCGRRIQPMVDLRRDTPETVLLPKSRFGDHKNYQGEVCSGSDKPPSRDYFGDSQGCEFSEVLGDREVEARSLHKAMFGRK